MFSSFSRWERMECLKSRRKNRLHIFTHRRSNKEKIHILFMRKNWKDFSPKLCMHIFGLISELSHITKQKYETMRREKRSHRGNPRMDTQVPTIVTPIYDRWMIDPAKYSWSSWLRSECLSIVSNVIQVHSDGMSNSIERKEIINLKGSKYRNQNRIIFLICMDDGMSSLIINPRMGGIDLWHSSSSVVQCFFFDILTEWFMGDKYLRLISEFEFFSTICFKSLELFYMIWHNLRDDRYIRFNDWEEKIHLSRVVDAIFQYDIPRISNHESVYRYQKDPNPTYGIFPSSFCSDNSQWKSIFSVVVIWWVHHFPIPTLPHKILCEMCRDGRFPDSSCYPDNIGFLDFDDTSSKKSEKCEKESLHNFWHHKGILVKIKANKLFQENSTCENEKVLYNFSRLFSFTSFLWLKSHTMISHSLSSMRFK